MSVCVGVTVAVGTLPWNNEMVEGIANMQITKWIGTCFVILTKTKKYKCLQNSNTFMRKKQPRRQFVFVNLFRLCMIVIDCT